MAFGCVLVRLSCRSIIMCFIGLMLRIGLVSWMFCVGFITHILRLLDCSVILKSRYLVITRGYTVRWYVSTNSLSENLSTVIVMIVRSIYRVRLTLRARRRSGCSVSRCALGCMYYGDSYWYVCLCCSPSLVWLLVVSYAEGYSYAFDKYYG